MRVDRSHQHFLLFLAYYLLLFDSLNILVNSVLHLLLQIELEDLLVDRVISFSFDCLQLNLSDLLPELSVDLPLLINSFLLSSFSSLNSRQSLDGLVL